MYWRYNIMVYINGIKLSCQRCGNSWEYKGENPYYAQCSRCKSSVNISKRRLDKNVED